MKILVTGGAGYIGSIVVEQLIKAGETVISVDNLQQGHAEAVSPRAIFVKADISDNLALDRIFENHSIDAVIHMAAEALVGESMYNPEKYVRTNVWYGTNLLNSMLKHGVNKLVFSSSAATYGIPRSTPIYEHYSQKPVNPYGDTKLMFEKILSWYSKAYGLKYVCLRYFNAAGASEMYGEDHDPETHLIPNILNAAYGQTNSITVYGTDYDTRDGSCIRDYVHVLDIADAHLLAAHRLCETDIRKAYNIGSEHGNSVLEVIAAARSVTGKDISVVSAERRPGDPPVLTASSHKAKKELGWEPHFKDIESIILSAWNWKMAHPGGYGSGRTRQ